MVRTDRCVNKSYPEFKAMLKEYGIEDYVLETLTLIYREQQDQRRSEEDIKNNIYSEDYPTKEFIIDKLRDDPSFNLQEEAKNYGIYPSDVQKEFPDKLPKDTLTEVGQDIVTNNFTDKAIRFHFMMGEGGRLLRNAKRASERLGKDVKLFFEGLDMNKKYNSSQPEYYLQKLVKKNKGVFDKFYNRAISNVAGRKLDLKNETRVKDYFLNDSTKNAIKLFRELKMTLRRMKNNYFGANLASERLEVMKKQLEKLENYISEREYDLGTVSFVQYLEELATQIQGDLDSGAFTPGKKKPGSKGDPNKRIEFLKEFVAFYRPMLQQIREYASKRDEFTTGLDHRLKEASEMKLGEMSDEIEEVIKGSISDATPKIKLDEAMDILDRKIETLEIAAKDLGRRQSEINAMEIVDQVVDDPDVKKQEYDKIKRNSTKNDYDDNIFRRWFGSIGKSLDVFLKTFQRRMIDANYDVKNYTLKIAREIIDKANELGIDRSKFGEKVTDKSNKRNFITEYDYEHAVSNTQKEFAKLNQEMGLPVNKDLAEEVRRSWRVQRPLYEYYLQVEDVAPKTHYITMKDGNVSLHSKPGQVPGATFEMTIENYLKSEEYRQGKAVVTYGKRAYAIYQKYWVGKKDWKKEIERKKKEWGKNSSKYKYWYSQNVGQYKNGDLYPRNELMVPKRKNKEYEKLTENEKTYLEYLRNLLDDANAKIPYVTTSSRRKPQIKADWVNSVFKKKDQRGLPDIVGAIREGFNFTKDSDDTMFGDEPVRRADGSLAYNVPTHFIREVENEDALTNDVIGSVILYLQMAENVKVKNELKPEYELLLNTLGERETTTKKGKRLDGKETNIYKELEIFGQTNLFGIYKDSPENDTIRVFGREFSIAKIADKFNRYVRNNNLAFRFTTAFVGALSSGTNFILERFVQEHVAKGTTRKASKVYATNMHLSLKEMSKIRKTNKLSNMLQGHFILQDIEAIFGNTDINNQMGRKFANEQGYIPYLFAEHPIKSITTLAVMMSHRLYKGKFVRQETLEKMGVEYQALPTYWDALNKDGRTFNSKYNVSDPSQSLKDMQSRVRSILNYTDGMLSQEDKAQAHRHYLGQYVATHRNWLFGGIDKRFHSAGVNYQTGYNEEGYYVTTINFMKMVYGERVASLKQLKAKFKELDAYEQKNVKRTLYEMMLTSMLITFGTILNKLSDDDESDASLVDFMAYLTTRTYIEFSTLQIVPAVGVGVNENGNPTLVTSVLPPMLVQSFDVIKSPITGVNQIDNLMDLSRFMEWGKEIESGPYEGFTRGQRALFKSFPAGKGITSDLSPEMSRRTIQNLTLEYWPD